MREMNEVNEEEKTQKLCILSGLLKRNVHANL